DFAARYAEGVCSAMAGCCGKSGYPHEPAACRTYQIEVWNEYAARSEQAGFTTYDPQAARDCLDAFAHELCICDSNLITEAQDDAQWALCNRVFVGGAKPAGAPCAADQECAQAPGMIAVCAGANGSTDAGGVSLPVCIDSKCQNVPPGSPLE